MRIWDINPGYLNRQSLLGEHRELHGIVSILINKKKGYSNHPETKRWQPFGWSLSMRHQMLAAEMNLRGYSDRTPAEITGNEGKWPDKYIDIPSDQFRILHQKYLDKEPGRILLPQNAQHLWAQHKYSILARNHGLYRSIGAEVSGNISDDRFKELALLLTERLRVVPSYGGIMNAVQHMWGHVSGFSDIKGGELESLSAGNILSEVQRLALTTGEKYLLSSTALSELKVWADYHENE